MHPLWIIDLTRQDDRHAHFRELVGRLHGVLTEEEASAWREDNNSKPCLWLYSRYGDGFVKEEWEDAESGSHNIYDFQEAVVRSGQTFVQMLRKSNADGASTLNVCVLGDATQRFTQTVFPSVAVMIQKEKGRILPNHIHQGMSIIGICHIPSNVNSLDAAIRQDVYLTIREIEVQHAIPSVRGYDRMFFCQDVQNRTESYFPIMNGKEQAEYLFQCLVHLYYACDKIHPLISGSSSDDKFYFSMGCASLFFDTTVQDIIDNENVKNSITEMLNRDGDLELTDPESDMIDYSKIDAAQVISKFQHIDFDLSGTKLDDPHPHPIGDFADGKLKKLYYGNYLKYYPLNLRLKIQDAVSRESESTLEEISSLCRQLQSTFADATLPYAIERQIATSSIHTGCITRIVRNLKALKTQIGKMKGRLPAQVEQIIWINLSKNNVPEELKDDFDSYHEAYCTDRENRSRSRNCDEMKQSAQEDFVNTLRQEATFMSRISRAFLTGIISVLTLMPAVTVLFTKFMPELCDIKRHTVGWSAFLFLLPLLIQFAGIALYYRKKDKKERRLKAYYLHDAYARITSRIESESRNLYDYMTSLCDEYLKRCRSIDSDIRPTTLGNIYDGLELPVTMFNQPAVSGLFAGMTVINDEEEESREIYVQRVPTRINALDDEDCHLLIHQYKSEMMTLFDGIRVRDLHERVFDENLGYKVFISKAKQDEADEKIWTQCRNLFFDKLQYRISQDMLPRRHPTVSEKILFYSITKDREDVLAPLVCAAATNGELTSSADTEYADVKSNSANLKPLIDRCMPSGKIQYQVDSENPLLCKYLFLTRWRTFDSVALNRILPPEDFDAEIRRKRLNRNEWSIQKNATSSLILWAICQNDNSSEWLKLFDATHFNESMSLRDIYASKLNASD